MRWMIATTLSAVTALSLASPPPASASAAPRQASGTTAKAAAEAPAAALKKPKKRTIKNDYPYKTRSWRQADPWNFFYRECTSFAAYRVRSRLGVKFHNYYRGVRWGHANNWDNTARKTRVKINRTPAEGAIAQFNAGRFGHVAYVARVYKKTILVEEYNKGGTHRYGKRTISRSSPSYYIHF